MSQSTISLSADTPPLRSSPGLWVWIVLLLAGAFELWDALTSVPLLFGNLSEIPGPGLGGALMTAKIALRPVFAAGVILASLLAATRTAIVLMAAIAVIGFVAEMPSLAQHGLELGRGSWSYDLFNIALQVAAPLGAMVAMALAIRDRGLGIAVLLSVMPMLLNILGVVVFTIGVMIYGF
jgi:hypothetical protein